jgi:hypothetical protein
MPKRLKPMSAALRRRKVRVMLQLPRLEWAPSPAVHPPPSGERGSGDEVPDPARLASTVGKRFLRRLTILPATEVGGFRFDAHLAAMVKVRGHQWASCNDTSPAPAC